jgi:hypothetical protein
MKQTLIRWGVALAVLAWAETSPRSGQRVGLPLMRWLPIALAALLPSGLAVASEQAGPPEPPPLRAYDVPGFDGVDERALRRDLDRSLNLYVAAAMADFGSTNYALNRGGREANPIIAHRALVAPVKVMAVMGTLRTEEKLRRAGHDGWADVVRWGFFVLNVAAAAWNVTR